MIKNPIMRLRPITLFILLLALQFACSRGFAATFDDRRPNVIHIMADDLGYGDLGSYGQTLIRTPNLDRLAAEGMRFTQYYAGSAACNPSRFAFTTGKHAGTTGVVTNGANRLPLGGMTVARLMREAGYHTGIIGKWALGDAGTSGEPLKQGFDYFFGYPTQDAAHNYYPEALTENQSRKILEGNKDSDRPGVAAEKATYAPGILHQRVLAFLKANSRRHFYLQVDFNLPHVNSEMNKRRGNGFEHPGAGRYAAKEDWTERERSYAELVSLMDDYVGELVNTLRDLGIAENTLVIFTSDNGPAGERRISSLQRFAAAGSFKGWKGQLFEGGIRVPMIAWWPDTIDAGTTNNSITTSWDVLPTLAELVGSDKNFESDGRSFAGVLTGEAEVPAERLLYWQLMAQRAVRYGDWKWVRTGHHSTNKQDFLYNIALDPGEKNDLADLEPEQLQRLQGMAQKYE
jgi:arylsulfatase A-like enzyme